MKATIDIPEGLYRRVKARAALDGRTVREVSIELYTRWLDESAPDSTKPMSAAEWLARWEELGRETARKAIDPRTTLEILLADRR